MKHSLDASSLGGWSRSWKRNVARRGAAIEVLEPRRLLSISASSLPLDSPQGTVDVFQEKVGETVIASEFRTIVGPTTFNGNSVSEVDTAIYSSDVGGNTTVQKTFIALSNDGWVTYGMQSVTTAYGGTSVSSEDVTYAPPQLIFPATMDAGTSYNSTVTENDSVQTGNGNPVVSTAQVQMTVVLTSETLQTVQVPWSTFGADLFNITTVRTPSGGSPTTTHSQEWIAPSLGLVKIASGSGEEDLANHTPPPPGPPGGGGGGGGGGLGEGGAVTSTLSGNLPASLIAGQKALISQIITLADSGVAYASSTTAALFLGTGTSIDGSSISLPAKITKSLKLKTGAQTTLKLSLRSLPASVPPGIYHIIAQVTDSSGNVSESASSGTITVAPPQVDLGVTVGKFTSTAKAGKKFGETIIVTNTGNTTATGPLTIQVQMSPDGNPANGTSLTSITKQINLKPSKSMAINLSLLVPTTGSPFLIFILDPSNTFSDVNLANNTAVSAAAVTVS